VRVASNADLRRMHDRDVTTSTVHGVPRASFSVGTSGSNAERFGPAMVKRTNLAAAGDSASATTTPRSELETGTRWALTCCGVSACGEPDRRLLAVPPRHAEGAEAGVRTHARASSRACTQLATGFGSGRCAPAEDPCQQGTALKALFRTMRRTPGTPPMCPIPSFAETLESHHRFHSGSRRAA